MAKKKINHEWDRVKRTPQKEWEKNRMLKNRQVLGSEEFKKVCGECGIPPTKRQASKFNNKKGIVYKGCLKLT